MAGGESKTRIDSSSCAKTAMVTTVKYTPPTSEKGIGSRTQEYAGEVQPHPSINVVLDGDGNIISSEADLAVIFLEVPVEGSFPPVELAETEAKVGELLVMVGYGSDEVLGTLGGKRRFRENPVTKVLASGRGLFDQPKWNSYRGDSGGPCLRETGSGTQLVGILSRGLGKEASFTSTYGYRDWLHEEIQRAAKASAAMPHDAP